MAAGAVDLGGADVSGTAAFNKGGTGQTSVGGA